MSAVLRKLDHVFRWLLQPLLVVAVLVLGFLGAMRLSSAREAPPRHERASYAPLVRVLTVTPMTSPVVVEGNGTLEARTRVDLVPQVGGRVVEMHPALRAGGRFAAGEVLARIEAIDFELALARAESEVSTAATALELERAEADASIAEWTRLDPDQPPPELVARAPQIRAAEARLDASRAQLEGARLDLLRTELTLPFDGRVVQASLDVGQVLTANQPVASVYATDVYEVAVPLEVGELVWIGLPSETGEGSTARVRLPFDDPLSQSGAQVQGRVVRLEGEVDRTSRLARVIVEVETAGLAPELAERVRPGLFADVELDGGELASVIELPREAMREDGVVWVVEEGRLRFRAPRVLRATDSSLFVTGLGPGARVVTSNLEVVTDGMEVRVAQEERPDVGGVH